MTVRPLIRAALLIVCLGPAAAALAQPPEPPPIDFGDEDIRDIREPLPIDPPWWALVVPWLAAGAAVAGAAGVGWIALRRLRRPPGPRAVALARIDAARRQADAGDAKAFSDAVSEAIRGYIESRFDVHAPKQTTEELLSTLARDEGSPLAEHRAVLGELLVYCDAAKFGAFSLARQEMDAMAETAVRFVERTSEVPEEPGRRAPGPATGAPQPSGGAT